MPLIQCGTLLFLSFKGSRQDTSLCLAAYMQASSQYIAVLMATKLLPGLFLITILELLTTVVPRACVALRHYSNVECRPR